MRRVIVEPPTSDSIFPNFGILSPTNTIMHTIPVRTKHRFQWNSVQQKNSVYKWKKQCNNYERSTKYFIFQIHVITLHCFYELHSQGFITSLQETRKSSIRITSESVNWGQMQGSWNNIVFKTFPAYIWKKWNY